MRRLGPVTAVAAYQRREDDNDVWTGNLTLPKGTKFEIQVAKSTVSGTSGGVNKWSATRYKSVLDMPASYDFGEFTTNLIPNGNFDEGQAPQRVCEYY